MDSTRRRAIAIAIVLAMVAPIAPAPATALTLQRTWWARLGTNGANGTVTLKAYTSGVGSIRYSLKGLKVSATYSVQIRNGTCSKLGTIAARLAPIRTTSYRTVSSTVSLTSGTMYWIWKAARGPSFVVRILSGTSIRCGNFAFNRATRVAVPSVGIDLPVIRGSSSYPPCRVALYLPALAQPREAGVTFIYAHARSGMFLPLLRRWQIDRGKSLLGRTIQVWTSDNKVVYYRINRVRVTTNGMAGATSLRYERIWLQTSTGPNTTYPKLIVEGYRYAVYRTTYAAAHPTPRPVTC